MPLRSRLQIMPHHSHELHHALHPSDGASISSVQVSYHLSILERAGIPHNLVDEFDAIIEQSATSLHNQSESEMGDIMDIAHRIAISATTMALWLDQRELQHIEPDPWTNPKAFEGKSELEWGEFGCTKHGKELESWIESEGEESEDNYYYIDDDDDEIVPPPLGIVKLSNEESPTNRSRPGADRRGTGRGMVRALMAERRSDPTRIALEGIDEHGYLINRDSNHSSGDEPDTPLDSADTVFHLPVYQQPHPEAKLIQPPKASALLGLGPSTTSNRVSSSSSSFASSRSSTVSSRSSSTNQPKAHNGQNPRSLASRTFAPPFGFKASTLLGMTSRSSSSTNTTTSIPASTTTQSSGTSPPVSPRSLGPLSHTARSSSLKATGISHSLIPPPSMQILVRRHSRSRTTGTAGSIKPSSPVVAGDASWKGSWGRRVGGRVAARIASAATDGDGDGDKGTDATDTVKRKDRDGVKDSDWKGSWRSRMKGKLPAVEEEMEDAAPRKQPQGPREMARSPKVRRSKVGE